MPSATIPLTAFNATPFAHADPSPIVAELVAGLREDRLKLRDEKLASFHTRNSYSKEAVEAAEYLRSEMERLGCRSPELHKYRSDFSANVHCVVPGSGTVEDVIVVGAHYDSRSASVNDPTQRAPGVDALLLICFEQNACPLISSHLPLF